MHLVAFFSSGGPSFGTYSLLGRMKSTPKLLHLILRFVLWFLIVHIYFLILFVGLFFTFVFGGLEVKTVASLFPCNLNLALFWENFLEGL